MKDDDKNLDGFGDLDTEIETELPIISMLDENGDEVDFAIISSVSDRGSNYLLVVEADLVEDDEADAIILKEAGTEDGEAFYDIVEDDEEFERCLELFKNSNDDYEIEA